MKKILVLSLMLVSTLSIGQKKRETLVNEQVGSVHLEYQKISDIDKNETIYMVWLGYQNEQYSHIIDTESIAFFNQEKLSEFIDDLKKLETQMLLKEKVDMEWTKSNYSLKLYNFNSACYLTNKDGAYSTVHLKFITKLIGKLSAIEIGKDTLKTI